MAEDVRLEPDYESVDPDLLRTYQVMEPEFEDQVITTGVFEPLQISSAARGEDRIYKVEVEYTVDSVAMVNHSVWKYLKSYEDARVTQETMTQMVYRHLRYSLDADHDELFVSVQCTEVEERTRKGAIK